MATHTGWIRVEQVYLKVGGFSEPLIGNDAFQDRQASRTNPNDPNSCCCHLIPPHLESNLSSTNKSKYPLNKGLT